jgi:hypothetical protein
MSDNSHSHPGDLPAADPDVAGGGDPLELMREQLAQVSAGDMVAETALPLLTFAFVRLGLPPEQHAEFRDLDAARLLIDALGGMLEATRGRLGAVEQELHQGLASARMAYVQISEHEQAEGHGTPPPAGQAQGQPDTGLSRPPGGLWVPGME